MTFRFTNDRVQLCVADLLRAHQKQMPTYSMTLEDFEKMPKDWTHHGHPDNQTEEGRTSRQSERAYLSFDEMGCDFGIWIIHVYTGMERNPRAGQEYDMGPGREPNELQRWVRYRVVIDGVPAIQRDFENVRYTRNGRLPRDADAMQDGHKALLKSLRERKAAGETLYGEDADALRMLTYFEKELFDKGRL